MSLHIIRKKKCFTVFFQLLLGVFFSTRSVALVDDLPNMEESQGYKSSARFVVKYSITAMTVKVYTFQSRLITFQKKSEPPLWRDRFRHPSFFVVGTFEVWIRGVQNFIGFFEKIFQHGLCQRIPSVVGGGNFLECTWTCT